MVTDEFFQAKLNLAKTFKAKRIAEIELEIEDAKRALADSEKKLDEWSKKIPFELIGLMASEQKENLSAQKSVEEKSRLEAAHSFAIRQAYEHRKGMLPAGSADSKSMTFSICGALMLGFLAMFVAHSRFGLENESFLTLVGFTGGVFGFIVGGTVFDQNFVIDESLGERPLFPFAAHETTRRTFFKNGRG